MKHLEDSCSKYMVFLALERDPQVRIAFAHDGLPSCSMIMKS